MASIKIWNGTSWADSYSNVWNGSAWVPTNLKTWVPGVGTAWSGTITQGYSTSAPSIYTAVTNNGFDGFNGGVSPTSLSDTIAHWDNSINSKLITAWYDEFTDYAFGIDTNNGILSISGFSSDPLYTYLTSAQVGVGAAKSTATATYNFLGTTATWIWADDPFGFGPSGTVSGVLI